MKFTTVLQDLSATFTVDAEFAFEKFGLRFYVHPTVCKRVHSTINGGIYPSSLWFSVSESATASMIVDQQLSIELAIEKAKKKLEMVGETTLKELLTKASTKLTNAGFSLPLNH